MRLSFAGSLDVYYYVFQATSSSGPYTPVAEKIVSHTGIGQALYPSGPMHYMLQPGMYYAIGAAWGATTVSYYRQPVTFPAPWLLGTLYGYLSTDTPPPYTGPVSGFYTIGTYDMELCFGSSASVTYDVLLGNNLASLNLVATNLSQPICSPGLLAFNTTYYWQVVASNVVGSVTGAVWQFTTALDEVRFASTNPSISEGAGSALITVLRENPAGGPVSVHYATANGTATAGSDYTAVSGTLSFPAGVTSTSFSVDILDDTLFEENETVLLLLSQITPNVFLGSNAVLTIIDNEGPPDFQIAGLLTNNSRVVDHNALTGDDRGGIAVSASQVFVTGDSATAHFNAADLTGGTSLGIVRDSLCSDLRTETVYLLGNGSTPLTSIGGTVTTLIELNGATGQPTGAVLPLSQSFSMPSSSYNGIFSGYGRVVVYNGTRVYDIFLPSGRVTDRGVMTRPSWYSSENWAVWGVAEHFGGALYLAYRESGRSRIVRSRVPDGLVTALASFSNLSDLASFTVSPSRNRWYFHYEGSGQFGGTSETLGYADAELFSTNPPVIIAQPVNQTARPGTNITFCVTARGALPLSYQWRKDGTNLIGATGSCLTLINVVEADSGQYSVFIANTNGSVVSSNATLWVTMLDHFAWSPIPSPQLAGVAFPVTITAHDESDTVVSNFARSVNLTGWMGLPGVNTNRIVNPGFESGSSGWGQLKVGNYGNAPHTGSYGGMPTEGGTYWYIYTYHSNAMQVGNYGCITQAVDVSGLSSLIFDVSLYAPSGWQNRVKAEVRVDGVSKWIGTVGGLHTNQSVDLSSYTGLHTLELRSEVLVAGTYSSQWVMFDNLRTAGGGVVAVAIMPTNSGNFANGAWTGDITVLQPATNVYLVATDITGLRGISTNFDVLAARSQLSSGSRPTRLCSLVAARPSALRPSGRILCTTSGRATEHPSPGRPPRATRLTMCAFRTPAVSFAASSATPMGSWSVPTPS